MSTRPSARFNVVWTALAAACAMVLPTLAGADTLAQALAYAVQASPTLNAERARQRSDDENVARALSAYRPTIAATAEFGPRLHREAGRGRSAVTQPLTAGISLDQTIADFGRTAASVRSAESGVFAGRETLRGVEQTVLLAAVTAYMGVLRDVALADLQRRNIVFLQEVLRVTRKRVETGDLSPTNTSQAEARLARGRADLASADANLVASRASYRQAIGREPNRIAPPETEPRLPAALGEALAEGRSQSPAIRNALHLIDVAASDLASATAALRPTIAVSGRLSRTLGRSADPDAATPVAALAVNVPVYDGGLTSASIRQSKEVVGQRRIELAVARDQVQSDIRAAWGVREAARATTVSAEAAVRANEVALAGVQSEASSGQRTILDVLNAQQELVGTNAALLGARAERVVATYGLLASMGGLTAARLGVPARSEGGFPRR